MKVKNFTNIGSRKMISPATAAAAIKNTTNNKQRNKMKMNNSALASNTRIINPCNISLFENSYIECFKELLELENAGITNKNIRFFITENGKHYCQLWDYNLSLIHI